MDNVWVQLLIQIVTGIIGGQAVGAAIKNAAMTQLPKILAGGIGGIAGGQILQHLGESGALGGAWDHVVGGVGGGAILTAIVGAVMGAMKK
jgi:hypothetical protein